MDLNVFLSFRKKEIGSMFLEIAEKEATLKSYVVGLG
jgi:hypothetical protein